jgi:hypothetical protein
MEGLDTKTNTQNPLTVAADPLTGNPSAGSVAPPKGTSLNDTALEKALNESLAPDEQAPANSLTPPTHGTPKPNSPPTTPTTPVVDPTGGHDHTKPLGAGNFELDISLDKVDSPRSLDVTKVGKETNLRDDLGTKGDYLNPGGGSNTVIASGDSDIIRGTGRGFNTITTGTGKDTIILGQETTNRIFDFDPANDRMALSGINPKNIVVAQGKNPGKGGIAQPLDSVNNTLIIDKRTGHILAALTFVKATDINESHFTRLTPEANASLRNLEKDGFKTQRGDGKLTGTLGHDRLIGGAGDDFLYVGNDGFKFESAKGSGPGEFPFKNDSPGTSELMMEMKDGIFKASGSYKDFQGLPLFSDGVNAVSPDAVIPNGADPKALIDNFLKVPKDVEGNAISGFHLHFSRLNFADATVERYFSVNRTDDKSGTVSAEFEFKPEEQAALLAGNFYTNLHSTIHPVGENRLELNTVKFA